MYAVVTPSPAGPVVWFFGDARRAAQTLAEMVRWEAWFPTEGGRGLSLWWQVACGGWEKVA
jgi:hypothetical protein